jgi:hypothetical protein
MVGNSPTRTERLLCMLNEQLQLVRSPLGAYLWWGYLSSYYSSKFTPRVTLHNPVLYGNNSRVGVLHPYNSRKGSRMWMGLLLRGRGFFASRNFPSLVFTVEVLFSQLNWRVGLERQMINAWLS